MRMKAMAMPGRVAWLRASLRSARFRSRRNVPTRPAAIPSKVVPMMTTRVL